MNRTGNGKDIGAETVPSKKFSDYSITSATWGYTYFIQRGDAIKIGHSAIPKQRISNIRSGAPTPVEILAIVPNTIVDESTAHAKFAHLRISGEWFRAEPDLIEFILSVKVQAEALAPKPKNRAAAAAAKTLVKQLHALRKAHGNNTPMGHAASNLAEIAPLLPDYVRPEWATDDRQTLPYLANQQLKRIERLKAATH